MTVWQPTAAPGSLGLLGATAGMVDFVELDRAAAEAGGRVADEGVRIAQEAGLDAEPVAVEATGPVWKTIVEIADRHDAATIVMGSRGLTGLRVDAARKRLQRRRASRRPAHADHPATAVLRALDAGARESPRMRRVAQQRLLGPATGARLRPDR